MQDRHDNRDQDRGRDAPGAAGTEQAMLRRMRRLAAEAPGGPGPEELAALARVLSAAAVPAEAIDPAGENAAVEAFRAAHSGQHPGGATVGTDNSRRTGRGRTTAFGVVIAALLGGGVAIASTGLPLISRGGEADHAGRPAPTSTVPDSGNPHTGGLPTSHEDRHRRGSPSPEATDPARLTSLCRSFAQQPSALDSAALRPLVSAAGSPSQVKSYCGTLLTDTDTDTDTTPAPTPTKGNNGNGNGNNGNGNGNGGSNGNNGNGNGGANGNQGNGNGGANGNQGNGNGGANGNQGNGNGGGNGNNGGGKGNQGNGNGGNNGGANGNQGNGNNGGANGNQGNGNNGRGNGNQGNGNQGNGGGNGNNGGANKQETAPLS